MSSLTLLAALPEPFKTQFDNGELVVKMISVNVPDMEVQLQRAIKEGWMPIKSFADGDRAWAMLVTPATTQNGDG